MVFFMKILITGGSSGIGFLTGCVLASRGHDVILTTKTNLELEKVKEKITLLGLNILVVKVDITEEDDVKNIMDYLSSSDVLFLHAGVGNIGMLSNMPINLIKDIFDVNVFSNLNLIQKFLINDKKKVVMTSSLLAGKSIPFFSGYSMSKKCIDMMMKTLKRENIFNDHQFVLIKPGAYHTGFNQHMVLTGEKSGLSSEILIILNKVFLLMEEKELNSIVYKIVIAIEKGKSFKYSAPFYQSFLMFFIK